MSKVKVTIMLSDDVADALHAASLAAGGYGKKSEIVETALRRELGLMTHREDAIRDEAIRTVNRLRAVRRDRGALSAQEQADLSEAMAALEGETLTWQAYLGDWLMGEGDTEEAAIAAAVAEYEDAIGYGDEIPDRDTLMSRLELQLS